MKLVVYSECDSFGTFSPDENSFMPGKSVDKAGIAEIRCISHFYSHCILIPLFTRGYTS